ncbi:MAG: DEAD/DEAH box helicase [Elusimicrobiota bacterium]
MPFTKLGLHHDLVEAIKAMGFTEPTPIQREAIPIAIEGHDLLGCAQTGSGKTAAFALPALNRLLKHKGNSPRILILVPTRELATQVESVFLECGRFTHVKTVVIIGGAGFFGQKKAVSKGAEVVVATPGRLLDHLDNGSFRLDKVEMLVLDEADRMLDMGFIPDVRNIIGRLPKERQTMLFSATLNSDIERIASFALRHPKRVEISRPASTPDSISQIIYPISQDQKSDFLLALMRAIQMRSVLIFCRTKRGADRLSRRLIMENMSVGVLHADKTQSQRTAAMDLFRRGKTQILVATDIAARGIDVHDISHVINYDVPQHAQDYVHRVGRTARAYKVGDAIMLMDHAEQSYVTMIERFVGITFPRALLPNFPYKVVPQLAPSKPRTLVAFRSGRRFGGTFRGRR